MHHFRRQALFMCLTVLTVLLGVGCGDSKLAERRHEHAKEYAALSGEEKASVDHGALRVGMTTNAVLIAWGPPTVISSISTPKGPYVFWEYYRKKVVTQDPQIMVPRSPAPVPQSRVFPETAASSTKVFEYLDRSAVFHDERLVNWEPK